MTTKQSNPADVFSSESWLDDACILDIDFFVKTLSGVKSKGVCPDLIGSIITHYASKWLPEVSSIDVAERSLTQFQESPERVAVSWMKKRFFVETLLGVLPPERNSIPCNFLLRLLRTANMVGVEAAHRSELEMRISWQLDEASLKELMIPSFNHTCDTLLDVELAIRLVNGFVSLDREGAKSGAALVKVAKLVDSYLAEAAIDANLSLSEFVALAGALPTHARATDDGLYRAIDTYLKAHPGVSKQERKVMCRLIDSAKLTLEASLHAAQNERLPVRAVLQVLFSEQTKLNRQLEPEPPARCVSRRETLGQQVKEIKKLKEDVVRLQGQCNAMQAQMESMAEKKKLGFFRWKKLVSVPTSAAATAAGGGGLSKSVEMSNTEDDNDDNGVVGLRRQAPMEVRTRMVEGQTRHPRWRRSMS
ncbi:root phototropism protein 3 [Prosopis cineraria]|uniref:root phototropism protein 3 n=1 Tax=Prosopis cineraria TaxID=364024 RepID=UPI0024109C8C|nr:root phototropism protein 3 [Prosopis cineraria]